MSSATAGVPRRLFSWERSHDREILAIAVPALGALAADPLLSLADTAIVGRLGADALAALGICTQLFGFLFLTFNFLEYGTTALVARAWGAGDRDAAARVAGQGVLVATALGIGLGAAAVLATPVLVRVMGAGPSVEALAVDYFRIRCLGAAAFLFLRVGHGAFRGSQDARTPLWLTIGINAVNLVLALTFVYGFDWGVPGAAWATLTAQSVGAVGFGFALWRRGLLGRPRVAAIGAFLSVNADLFVRTGALVGAFTVGTAVAARLDAGGVAAAAHAIAQQVLLLLALLLDSVAIAGQALIGRYRGEEDRDAARAVSARMNSLELLLGCAFGVLFLALAGVLPRLFTSDAAVLEAVAPLLALVAVLQPVAAVLFGLDGILIGAGDSRFLALATLGAGLVCVGVTFASVALGAGLMGVWAGIAALLVVRAGANVWRFAGGGWFA